MNVEQQMLKRAQQNAACAQHPLVKAAFEADVRYLFKIVHSPLEIGVPSLSGAAHELDFYREAP